MKKLNMLENEGGVGEEWQRLIAHWWGRGARMDGTRKGVAGRRV